MPQPEPRALPPSPHSQFANGIGYISGYELVGVDAQGSRMSACDPVLGADFGELAVEAEILKEALEVAAGPKKGLLRSVSLPRGGSR